MKTLLLSILLSLSIQPAKSLSNGQIAYDYNYNLPVAINTSIELPNSTIPTTLGPIYNINNTYWNNNQLTSAQFLANITSIQDSFGANISEYDNVFNTLTGRYLSDNRYNYCVVIDSFIDNNDNYIKLADNNYYFFDLARIDLESPSIFIDNFFDINARVFEYNVNTSLVQDSPYLISDLFYNTKQIYLRGFICFSNTVTTNKELSFITQLVTYYNYGSKLNGYPIDYKATFRNLSYNYIDTLDVSMLYPYYHLGNTNYNALYYKGNMSYATNNALYKRVCIFDGLFSNNGHLYTSIIYNYKVVAVGTAYNLGNDLPTQVLINNTTISCAATEYVIIIDNVEYYNRFTGDFAISLLNNATLTNINTYNITNKYEYLVSMKTLDIYAVSYYGLNYDIDTNTGPLDTENIEAIKQAIISSESSIINAPVFRNYLENILLTYNDVDNLTYVSYQYDNTNLVSNVFDIYSLAFGSILSFFNIMIFPGVTIGLLLLIPLVALIITLIVKLFKR